MKKLNVKIMFLLHKRNIALIWILLSIVIITIAWSFFGYEKSILLKQEQNTLKEIAILKASKIEEVNKSRIADAIMFSKSPFFKDAIIKWVENKNKDYRDKILERLKLININNIYEDILIVKPNGKILISEANDSTQWIDNRTKKIIEQITPHSRVIFSDLYFCKTHKRIHIDYATPIAYKNKIVCVLVFRENFTKTILPIIKEWPISSRTAEIVLLEKKDDSVLYFSKLNQHYDSDEKLRFPLVNADKASIKAANGYQGFYEYQDNLKKDTYAYIVQIAGMPWSLIIKINTKELFAPVIFRQRITISLTILMLLIILFGLFWHHNYLKRYIYAENLKEEKLLVSHYKEFYIMLQSIGDGIISTDTEGRITVMNPVAQELTGWSFDEAKNKSITDVFHIINEQSRQPVANPIYKVIEKGIIVGLANHTILISKSGKEIPISDSAAPVYDDLNLLQGIVLVFRDKTREHQIEKKIRENEARLERAEMVAKVGNWELNLDTGLITASNNSYLIYDIKKIDHLTFTQIQEYTLPEYRELLDNTLENLIEHNILYNVEFKIKTVTGQIKDIHSVAEFDKKDNRVFGVVQDITERKAIEQRIISIHERWMHLFNNSPSSIVICSTSNNGNSFNVTDFNNTAEKQEGIKRPDTINESIYEILPQTEIVNFHDIFYAAWKTNITKYVEPIPSKINGVETWKEYTIYKLNSDEIVVVINNVTKRVKAEIELRKSEEKFRILFNNMSQAFALHEIILNKSNVPIDYKFLNVNPAFEKLSGYNKNDIEGKTRQEIAPNIKDEFISIFGSVANTGKPIQFNRYSRLFNKFLDVWAFSPQEGLFATIFSDTTDKRKTEEQLKTLSKGIEQSPAIVVITDSNGNIEYVNPKFEEISGYKASEVIGKNSRILKSGKQDKNFYKNLWETILSGSDWKGELLNKKKNGEYYWVSTIITPITDQDNQIKNFIAIKEDITKRKEWENEIIERDIKLKEQNEEYLSLNEELKERNERIKAINLELSVARNKAEESDNLKSIFLANMSHEIRTPMNGILGFTELLRSKKITHDQRLQYLDIINKSSLRLLEIIDNLINISKVETGNLEVNSSEIDVSQELKYMYLFFNTEAQDKGLTLLLQGGQELPQIKMYMDKMKFDSILTNLLKNALKFTEKGTIDFGAIIGNGFIEIYVADTGIGIPSSQQDKIFERFLQVDNSFSRKYEGAGLGLSIVKSFVDLLGGTISVDSKEGKGSTFYVNLPFYKDENAFKNAEKNYQEKRLSKSKKLKILIVDDDEATRKLLKELLHNFSSNIYNVQTGSEAVELCQEDPTISLILMDIKMPDMDGIEATRIIRQFNKSVPIIAQTAYTYSEDKEKALNAGCNDYISKPIDFDKLRKIIYKWGFKK